MQYIHIHYSTISLWILKSTTSSIAYILFATYSNSIFLVLFHLNGKPVLFFVYIPKSSPASSSPFDYQPISLLSLASKLLEKTTFWQRNPYFLLNFINCFSFLFCNFFRFLKSHKPHIHLSLCICITNNIYIFSIWFSSQPLNHFCSTVFTPFFSL